MTEPHPLMYGYTPQADAQEDARAFLALAPTITPARIRGRLEDLCMALAYFHDTGQRQTDAQAQALACLFFAASGLTVFLEAPPVDAWATLKHAHLWAAQHRARVGRVPSEVLDGIDHVLRDPHGRPWAAQGVDPAQVQQAARYTAWATVTHLLGDLPTLEDGDIEDMLSRVLSAFAAPWPAPGGNLRLN